MITNVKYIRDEKGNDSVVRIIYDNDTSVKITVQVDNGGINFFGHYSKCKQSYDVKSFKRQ